jgi:GH35 family endo-1,4-beta-xylanase
MKLSKYFIPALLSPLMLVGCADWDDWSYDVEKPNTIAGYEYLNDYAPLKEYVNRSSYANFKLGAGLGESEFESGTGPLFRLAAHNFDEVVAGNAMKMASCVNDNGDMDFSGVTSFIKSAEEAGVSVYGHTLAWHAQQPVKWLNSLLKDKELDIDPDALIETLVSVNDFSKMPDQPFPYYAMGCTPPIVNGAMHFESTGDWSQFFIFPGGNNQLSEGNFLVRLYMASNKEASGVQLTIQNGWSNAQNITVPIPVEAGDQVYELSFPGVTADPSANYDVILKPQTADCILDIKKIEFYKLESPAVEVEEEVNFYTYEDKPDGPFPHYPMGATPPIVNGALHFVPTGDWSQFFVVPGGNNELGEGDYIFYVDMAADKAASGVQLTVQNGWGGDAQNFTAAIPVEAGRHTYALKFPGLTGSPSKNYDVILKPQTADAVLDFYSLRVNIVKKLNSIPLTPEEKKDTLIWAMDRWIDGMMKACDGKVKAWDVVNEAISGGNPDSEGVYALQHAPEGGSDTDFFWQDYLDDYDYVRTAVRLARQYGPEGIKLFINDYNLESDWDSNGKLKSLIAWIKRWEADGTTKIDGIGTQMHISCYANASTQESKKKAIENMFKLMAASGKLVRVSELDMGYVDAAGNSVMTTDMTEEQHHQMADLYNWIVKKYFELIPANQQWGICQWCVTDAPSNSGWRKGEPVGLWTLDYTRKHTYAGFADGLAGK